MATTSFSNTPQAKDDEYYLGDASTTGTFYLNVLANDLGGKAKALWSIDDGESASANTANKKYAPVDLLTGDGLNQWEYTENGAKIAMMADGTIAFNTNTAAFQAYLASAAAGEEITESFTYAIRMANGTLSWATVTVIFDGVNDAPVANDDARTATEDVTLNAASVLGNDTDPDIEDLDVAAVKVGSTTIVDGGAGDLDGAANGSIQFNTSAGGTATIDLEGGTFSYVQNGVFNGLDTGETGADSFQYQATDGDLASGFATVSITVDGVNDAPTSTNDSVTTAEDTAVVLALADFGTYADVDGDPIAAVKITTLESNGSLEYDTTGGGTWAAVTLNQEISAVDITAGRLRFVPDTEENGSPYATIGFKVGDGTEFSAAAYTLTVNVTPVDDAPYILPSGSFTVFYQSQTGTGEVSFVNGFGFQDADSLTGIVRVTIATGVVGDALNASSSGGVTVGGSGTATLTLDGTIADINAFIYGNNIRWDPNGNATPDQTFTITIDDNGLLAGGNVVTGSVTYDASSPILNNGVNVVSFAGWNLNAVNENAGGGSDTITTGWNHGPDTTNVDYVGGAGSGSPVDSITLVFTAGQFEQILSDGVTFRPELQDYLDGAVGTGSTANTTLDLGASSWNATASGFETASLALAAGTSGFVTYTAIGSNLPDYLAGSTGDGLDNTLVGTTGGDTLSGLGGNDILVGLGGNDSLLGGSGSDLLLTGSGNDTLNGGTGGDILSGGGGGDNFAFDDVLSVDLVVDYSYVGGDRIDLSALLDANFGPSSTVSDFVKLTQTGSNVTVQVDTDGTGGAASFTDVAVLANYGSTNQDLVRVFFEGVDQTLKI